MPGFPASACLMKSVICSVVNRLFFISVLSVDGLYSFMWYGSVEQTRAYLQPFIPGYDDNGCGCNE